MADTYGITAEDLARSATLAETMADKLGPLLGAEQRSIAQADRLREREARHRERSYRAATDEATRLADEYRRRW